MGCGTKMIDIKEFRERGYLQEVNRQFLHPLGLALEVKIDDETGEESLGGIWDYRDDPTGIHFGDDMLDQGKYIRVSDEMNHKTAARRELFGGRIQPVHPLYPCPCVDCVRLRGEDDQAQTDK